MEWNEKLQRIIDYVEDHLQRREEPIDENVVSDIAGCSFGFFQKVFSYMNGISFSEYIRSRKLTLDGYVTFEDFSSAESSEQKLKTDIDCIRRIVDAVERQEEGAHD